MSTGRPPQYPHIAGQMRARLRNGTYPPYESLPTSRELAKEFGVAQATVMRALRTLQDDGLIWASNLGTFAMDVLSPPGENQPAREIFSLFGIPQDVVDDILHIHAHELAEKQRAWLASQGYGGPCVCGGCSWCLLQDPIDLIDPEVQT